MSPHKPPSRPISNTSTPNRAMSSRAIPITASNLVLSAALAVPVDVNDQDTGDLAAPIATPGRLSLTLGPGRTGVRRSAAVAAHGDEVRAVSRRRHGIPVHLDTRLGPKRAGVDWHDVEAGLQEAVADGELVIARKLGHALCCPGEQTLHAQRDYWRGRRRSAARRAFRLDASIRCSGPDVVLAVAGGQGFKSQGSRVTAFPLYATFMPPITNWSWRNEPRC